MYRKRNNVDPVRVPITHYNNSEVYSYIKLVEAISTKITNQEKLKKKKRKRKEEEEEKQKEEDLPTSIYSSYPRSWSCDPLEPSAPAARFYSV